MEKMKANVFHGKDDIRVEEVDRPCANIGDAVIRVTLTTISAGRYPPSIARQVAASGRAAS